MLLHHGGRDADRLTARVSEPAGRRSGCRLDARRIDEEILVDIELPGSDPAGIDVTAGHGILTVRAERRPGTSGGPARRRVRLPGRLDTDRLEARYDGGVLTVRIPVRSEPSVLEQQPVDVDELAGAGPGEGQVDGVHPGHRG